MAQVPYGSLTPGCEASVDVCAWQLWPGAVLYCLASDGRYRKFQVLEADPGIAKPPVWFPEASVPFELSALRSGWDQVDPPVPGDLTLRVLLVGRGTEKTWHVKDQWGDPETLAKHLLQVLPKRYACCIECGEPWPCHDVVAERVAENAARAVAAKDASVPPGSCWSCGQKVYLHEPTVTFPGMNLDLPYREPPVFHVGMETCLLAAVQYERRWLDANHDAEPRIADAGPPLDAAQILRDIDDLP